MHPTPKTEMLRENVPFNVKGQRGKQAFLIFDEIKLIGDKRLKSPVTIKSFKKPIGTNKIHYNLFRMPSLVIII